MPPRRAPFVRPTYVRIGRMPAKDEDDVEGITLRYHVVATVNKNDVVEFYGIDTWWFPQALIGAYDCLDRIADIYAPPRALRADPYFAGPYNIDNLEDAVKAWLAAKADGTWKTLQPQAIEAPLWPLQRMGGWPVQKGRDRSDQPIGAVIKIINYSVPRSMGLPRNCQAWLDADESYDTFRAFVETETETWLANRSLGWLLTDDDSPLRYWADLEFWVMPRGEQGLVHWSPTEGMVAGDFLRMWQPAGAKSPRLLYIEVRIVRDTNWKVKDTQHKQRVGQANGAGRGGKSRRKR
ncbi:unnamed protein product [Zymoseptoria tritici ST99CH_1A5]|uniref:Uncharacterized protein n=2 Tax=Zymoseptoria tritici TaxID=1047171 RepID=F9XKT0_ZYMTI|nr:uncharacterized protein MYCGRDRAFT_96402 [Zymoseptoria tritici IPO323]EGP83998.1 hypothetical protein MYCGRDRAFT_96402 [Zymoseptoria tritici IPO323]SMR63210.1 unnamed protein product [Zymoseptoria tritici ST99CH_3D1]SMY28591.1 unnamed protein product [Zymoseptoria tritici ST99CH_1A5]